MVISILGWLLVGLIIGALARLLLPGRDPMGCLATALLGIVGSFVGGFIGHLIWPHRGDYAQPGFLLSVVGAIIVLWVWRRVR